MAKLTKIWFSRLGICVEVNSSKASPKPASMAKKLSNFKEEDQDSG
jgi:hypothetical protein